MHENWVLRLRGATHDSDNNYYIANFNTGNCLSGLYCNIPLTFGDESQRLSGWRIEESFAVIHHWRPLMHTQSFFVPSLAPIPRRPYLLLMKGYDGFARKPFGIVNFENHHGSHLHSNMTEAMDSTTWQWMEPGRSRRQVPDCVGSQQGAVEDSATCHPEETERHQ